MNKLSVDVSRNVLVGEAWLPVDAKRAVQDALSRGSSSVQVSCTLRSVFVYHTPVLLKHQVRALSSFLSDEYMYVALLCAVLSCAVYGCAVLCCCQNIVHAFLYIWL